MRQLALGRQPPAVADMLAFETETCGSAMLNWASSFTHGGESEKTISALSQLCSKLLLVTDTLLAPAAGIGTRSRGWRLQRAPMTRCAPPEPF